MIDTKAVWIEYIPWIYGSIRGAITLIASISGVKYVRNEFILQRNRAQQILQLQIDKTKNNGDEHHHHGTHHQEPKY